MKSRTLSPTMHLPSIVDMTPAEKQAWIAKQAHRDRDLHNDVARRARAYQALCAELIDALRDIEGSDNRERTWLRAKSALDYAVPQMKELGK